MIAFKSFTFNDEDWVNEEMVKYLAPLNAHMYNKSIEKSLSDDYSDSDEDIMAMSRISSKVFNKWENNNVWIEKGKYFYEII